MVLYDDGDDCGAEAVGAAAERLDALHRQGKIRFKHAMRCDPGCVEDARVCVFFEGSVRGERHAPFHGTKGCKCVRLGPGRLSDQHYRITVDGVLHRAQRPPSSPSLIPVFTHRLRRPSENAPVVVIHEQGDAECRLWTSGVVDAAARAGRKAVFRTSAPWQASERYRDRIAISDASFNDDVDGAHVVAAYSDDALLAAACRRVPVICAPGARCVAERCASTDTDLAVSSPPAPPYAADVHDCLRAVAAEQWSMDEIRGGEAFQGLIA